VTEQGKNGGMWLRSPQSNWLTIPLLAFLTTRLLIIGAIYIPFAMGIHLDPHYTPDMTVLDIVTRWDSQWYITIVEEGYRYVPDATIQQDAYVVFFPLYPLFIRSLDPIVGDARLAGLLISNLMYLGSLILLYRLTQDMLDEAAAARTVFYLNIFPTSFFFSAIYTESVFLLATLLCYWSVRNQKWGLVGLSGVVASATRVSGVFIAISVAFEWMQNNHLLHGLFQNRLRKLRLIAGNQWVQLLAIATIPLGAIAYMVYLQLNFGNALAFVDAQSLWGRTTSNPVSVLIRDFLRTITPAETATHMLPYFDLFNIAIFLSGLMLVIPTWRKLGAGLALYCLLSLLLPAFSKMESMGRYVLVLFPYFIILGIWGKQKVFHISYVVLSLVLLLLFTSLFVNNIFIG